MKVVWLKGTVQVHGWTKGPPRHHETRRWNEETTEAIEEKIKCYKVWHKSKAVGDRDNYKEARRKARKVLQ